MLKKSLIRSRKLWIAFCAVAAVVAILTGVMILKPQVIGKNRTPAAFSQQDLQYAQFLWGDEEQQPGGELSGPPLPGVQSEWEDQKDPASSHNLSSDPLEQDLQKQIQEEYHSRLYEEWKERKRRAAEKAKKEENKTSGAGSAPASNGKSD